MMHGARYLCLVGIVSGALPLAGLRLAAADVPVAEEGLAGARRDYQAIEATKVGEARPQSALPIQPMPVLEVGLPAHTLTTPIRRAREDELTRKPGAKSKSANWLIDAMSVDKRTESRTALMPGGADDEELTDPSEDQEKLLERGLFANRRGDDRAQERRDAGAAPHTAVDGQLNPLGEYMAAWMTVKDFDLLKVSSIGAETEGGTLVGGLNPSSVTETVKDRIGDFSRSVSHAGLDRFANKPQKTNPYLEGFILPMSAPPETAESSLIETTAVPPSLMPTSKRAVGDAGESASVSRVPLSESLRGVDDAKYFKQLKRF